MLGAFITFEGTEGSGKSTQMRRVADRLRRAGRRTVVTREPGGTDLGERVRGLLKSSGAALEMGPEAELFLINACRAQLVREVIRPALERGDTVLCDRFSDSTVAYQGYGRGMDLGRVRALIDFATDGLRPDLTVMLRVSIALSEERRRARERSAGTAHRDRFEEADHGFFRRVETGYDETARADPERVRVIDASASVEDVFREVWRTIADRLELAEDG